MLTIGKIINKFFMLIFHNIFDFDGVLAESSIKSNPFNLLVDLLSKELFAFDKRFKIEAFRKLKNHKLKSTDWITELDEVGVNTANKEVASHISDCLFEFTRNSYATYDWVKNILPMLSQDVELAISSNNCRKTVEHTLGKLTRHFSSIKTYEDVTRLKPHPESLFAISSDLGIPPSKTLLIGNSSEDIIAAEKAGAQIAIASWGLKNDPLYEFNQRPFGIDLTYLQQPEELLKIIK